MAAACIFGECAFNHFNPKQAQILTSCDGYTSAAPFFFVERKRQTFQCSTNGDLPKQKRFAEYFSGCLDIRGKLKGGILSEVDYVLQI